MTTYRGSLKLAHGENKILVAVTYQQKDGTEFTVSKEYTIYYDEEKTADPDKSVRSDGKKRSHFLPCLGAAWQRDVCTDGNAKRYTDQC